MTRPASPATPRTVNAVRTATPRRRRAFTFVETLVVLFLIGILSAVVVARFSGGERLADDRVAQANADAALDAVAVASALDQTPTADPERLNAEAPDLSFLDASMVADEVGEVSVGTTGRYSFAVATPAADGSCFMARLSFAAEPSEKTRIFAVVMPGATRECSAASALLLTNASAQAGKGGSWRSPLVFS